MEKRRRARINESLGQLKTLILDALKKDVSIFFSLSSTNVNDLNLNVSPVQTLINDFLSPHTELTTLQAGESGHPRDDGEALEEPAARPDER